MNTHPSRPERARGWFAAGSDRRKGGVAGDARDIRASLAFTQPPRQGHQSTFAHLTDVSLRLVSADRPPFGVPIGPNPPVPDATRDSRLTHVTHQLDRF